MVLSHVVGLSYKLVVCYKVVPCKSAFRLFFGLVRITLNQICYLKLLANEDTLLPTQMFPRLPARETFVADTNFVSGTQNMFLILFRNILCPQQMFPGLRAQGNIMSNNVSSFASTLIPALLFFYYTVEVLVNDHQI